MSDRKYPREAWVLQPSFKPKRVVITGRAHPNSSMFKEWEASESGKDYHANDLHESKLAAIAVGREKLQALEAEIAKRQETLSKRKAALDKAELTKD